MKHFKILVIIAGMLVGSVFAQNSPAQAPATTKPAVTAKSTATQARDAVREARDAVDEARAAIALEKAAIATAQKGIADLALSERQIAQKSVDERQAAIIIAEKRLAQVSEHCSAPVVSTKKTGVAHNQHTSSPHVYAAAKAMQLAQASATATATASASGANASASATASAASAVSPVLIPSAPGNEVCRLRSDGTARLLSNRSVTLSRDYVIAVEKSDSASPSASVIARSAGEDCNAWRARVDAQLVDHKSN